MEYKTYYDSPIGRVLLKSDGESITALKLDVNRFYDEYEDEKLIDEGNLQVFIEAKDWLDRYFNGEKPEIVELSLAPKGSDFRQAVWNILCEIPYGKVITYGDIAEEIRIQMKKEHMSSQAVGGAVGHNPIGIIIPCHRVVGANGNLTGYGGGIANKIKLLELEGLDMSEFYIPKKGTAL